MPSSKPWEKTILLLYMRIIQKLKYHVTKERVVGTKTVKQSLLYKDDNYLVIYDVSLSLFKQHIKV